LKGQAALRRAQKANVLDIKRVNSHDFKNLEKQVQGTVRAQQEAKNMAGIDLQIGCLKALVDSQKRVILED
jgi:uncharacterized protein involved in tellurium resistance